MEVPALTEYFSVCCACPCRCGTNDAQQLPEQKWPAIKEFREEVIAKKVPGHLVVNMDQTMSRFDTVPRRTNEVVGSRTVRIINTKAAKKGFTVALAASGTGVKLPATIIFKERGGQLGPRVRQSLVCPDNVIVTATENGWMTRDCYNWWLSTVYSEHAGGTPDERALLVVDSYRPHCSDASKALAAESNADVVIVPAGCTSLIQPMDVSVNRPFKAKLQELWVEWFASHTDTTAHGNLRQPSRQQAIDWVSAAWDAVSSDTIASSFVLCGITAAADGSDDDRMFRHIPGLLAEGVPEVVNVSDGEESSNDSGDSSDETLGEMEGFDD